MSTIVERCDDTVTETCYTVNNIAVTIRFTDGSTEQIVRPADNAFIQAVEVSDCSTAGYTPCVSSGVVWGYSTGTRDRGQDIEALPDTGFDPLVLIPITILALAAIVLGVIGIRKGKKK